MKGISLSTTDKIKELVDDFFDKMAVSFLGYTPNLRKKKSIFFTSKPNLTLAHIFLKSLETEKPLPTEEEALKTILSNAESYIDSLREKTKAGLIHKIDSHIKEKRMKGFAPSTVDLKKEIQNSFEEAKNHFKTIVETESTKTRNLGKLFQISKVGASQGEKDPTVFWVIVRDGKTCLEENELVMTASGAKKIGEIKKGDILKKPSAPSQRGGSRVLCVEKQQKEVIELDFGSKKIKCTKDHPILVRSGKIFHFIEAERIEKRHDVVVAEEIKNKNDLKMISKAVTPRDFMKKLGYFDAWDFWRENIKDILSILRNTKKRDPVLKKYGISVPVWDNYVKYIIEIYDPSLKLKDEASNNYIVEHIGNFIKSNKDFDIWQNL